MEYRILGECVFGNRQMVNGRMDTSQFIGGGDFRGVATEHDGIFGLGVARQYGAEPITQIEFTGDVNAGVIDVYNVGGEFAATMDLDGWNITMRNTLENTASPLDICSYFDRPFKEMI